MMLRAGDIGVLLAGAGAVAALAVSAWGGGAADTVVIRAAGKVVETTTLARAQTFAVPGPLGTTRVEIAPGRARPRRRRSLAAPIVRQAGLAEPRGRSGTVSAQPGQRRNPRPRSGL